MKISVGIGNFFYRFWFPCYRFLYWRYKKSHDVFEIRLFDKLIKPGSVILDIGANIGFYSTVFSHITGPKGVVHCFEPDVTNFKHLKEAAGELQNVIINQSAISDRAGKTKMYLSPMLNVDHRIYPVNEYRVSYEVNTTTIDEYVNDKFQIDFIKMDIQGAEFAALKGMEKTLKKNPGVIVVMEIFPAGLKLFGVTIKEVIDYINSFDFICYVIESNSLKLLDAETIEKYELYDEYQYDNLILSRKTLESFMPAS